MKKIKSSLCIFLVVLFLWPFPGNATERDSIQLFTNGSIYVDEEKKADNLLVVNGVVRAINVSVQQHKDASIIDLNGSAAYPGFIDSHAHLMESGYFFYVGANLIGCTDANSMAKALEDKVKSAPEKRTILGAGFSLRDYDNWSLEDLAKIDEVTGNRPAFLGDKLGHNAVVNTAAMELAGLTPSTSVPIGGKMGMEDGRLTGMLRESAMTLPWNKMFAKFDDEDIKAGTLIMLKKWASLGYTGAVDLMGATGLRFMMPELFYEMEKDGTLPLRINYCYTIFNLSDVDDAAKYRGNDTDMVRFLGCKIFVDGAFAGGQAWTSWQNLQGGHGIAEIYTDDAGGREKNLTRIVERVEDYGMNMHYHVQGDLAIEAVLDALDKVVAKKGKLTGVHTLIHMAFPSDEQIERIKKFDGHVVATVQPAFWSVEDDTAYYYGEHNSQAYPIKKLIDSKISVGISTDFSVSPPEYSPATMVIRVATTGGGDQQIHLPLSVREVIRGLTTGSTATTSRNDTGVLYPGYKADIVVYDQDLYYVPLDNFSKDNPKVLATYVGGRQVYSAA
ncbi:MAG: isoaspartyl dipeptidase [Methanosaeta sp. PtaB.Bin018]|nr:MAG: isoaspartyl dipeptidase [Methanosaeta sp. PtaB.Bin018]OPY47512.1 MAG: isoaspartyl dipeptidase [Methanosaeta sp. PtaU1.Bin016]